MPKTPPSPPLLVLNLPSARQRWQALAARCRAADLPVQRLVARDPTQVPPPATHALLSPSQAACAWSHLAALQTFLQSGAPWGLIAEDDIVFDDRFPAFLTQTLGGWMQDCDLVKLEGLVYAYTSTTGLCLATGPGVRLLIPLRPSLGSACYAITRAGAQRLLQCYPSPTAPWDHLLVAYEQHHVVYGECRPFLVWQDGAPSSIETATADPVGQRRRLQGGQTLWRGLRRLGGAGWWYLRARLRGRAEDYA